MKKRANVQALFFSRSERPRGEKLRMRFEGFDPWPRRAPT